MSMLVNARSAHRYSFSCPCCKLYTYRKLEKRNIKRRERQQWKREVTYAILDYEQE